MILTRDRNLTGPLSPPPEKKGRAGRDFPEDAMETKARAGNRRGFHSLPQELMGLSYFAVPVSADSFVGPKPTFISGSTRTSAPVNFRRNVVMKGVS